MPSDPTLWLYTSLTAGSSHIITATSRIETILKANKIPFKAVDCATDDKARMLWARRSKGRKIPGLVKFNDVIADLEQVEEWNEYGELEEQIEDQIDIFGDVPISATAAEAQAAAAARTQAQEEARKSAATGTGRTASETRHISISEPTGQKRKESDATPSQEKKDSPLSMAMRQAGAEAAAKAGQKKTTPATAASGSASTTTKAEPAKTPEAAAAKEAMPPPAIPASVAAASKLETDAADPDTAMTDAKTPDQLASEGAKKTSVDKINSTSPDEEASNKSNPAQVIEQRRKSSVPTTPSSLAKTTSIDESHTVAAEPEKPAASSSTESKKAEPTKTASTSAAASKPSTATKKPAPVAEEDEDEDEDEDDDDSDDEEEEEEDEKSRPTKAAKISATSKEEEKVLKGTKPQEADAKDASQAGVSVAD